MDQTITTILAPLADKALQKIMSGGKVRGNDLILLLAVQMSRDISSMRESIGGLNDTMHTLNKTIGELRVEIAELRGRLA